MNLCKEIARIISLLMLVASGVLVPEYLGEWGKPVLSKLSLCIGLMIGVIIGVLLCLLSGALKDR